MKPGHQIITSIAPEVSCENGTGALSKLYPSSLVILIIKIAALCEEHVAYLPIFADNGTLPIRRDLDVLPYVANIYWDNKSTRPFTSDETVEKISSEKIFSQVTQALLETNLSMSHM